MVNDKKSENELLDRNMDDLFLNMVSNKSNINKIMLFRKKSIFKDIIWSKLLKLGANSNLISMALIDIINDFPSSNLYNLKYYSRHKHKDYGLAKGEVACIMCTWMEEKIVPFALESSKDFVDKYIVIDKDNKTVPIIKKYRDIWELDMEIYVKPHMSLRESRAYALTKIDQPWVLIQDGDMIFHTDGPNSIQNLKNKMILPNVVFCTPFNVLVGDFLHTDPMIPQMKPHMFLYHNNGTLRPPNPQRDFIVMDGWKIYLGKPYVFNCIIKSPDRMFLRQFWNEWCQDTNYYKKYPYINDYVEKELNINIDQYAEKWLEKKLANIVPYNENKWGYYPEVIRKNLHLFKVNKIK